MRTSSLVYLIKEGARNVYHNRLMSFASIGVLVACLLLIGSAVLLSVNINSIIGFVENQNEVVVFIKDDATQSDADDIQKKLESIKNITSIKYISKEDGLKKYREMFGETSYLLDGLDNAENPLPNSFRISVDDLSILKETISEIQQINGVIKINAALEIADTVTEVKHAVAIAGSFIVALLVIVSFVIIANTIKITVFNRRKEINIMKYVGATDSFIRLPFIIEGMLIGLISAVIAFFALWIGYGYLVDWVMKNPSPMIASIYTNIVPFVQIAKPLSLGFLGSGIGIGVIGSMMFVRKYLKV